MSGRRRAPRRGRGPDELRALGEALRAARHARGWTIEQLARRARLGEKTVRRFESGHGGHVGHLLRLLRPLGHQLSLLAPLPNCVMAAAIDHIGAEWLSGRPALSAPAAALLAGDIEEDIEAKRWHGGAETTRRQILATLHRLGPRPRPRTRKDRR